MIVFIDFFEVLSFSYWFSFDTTITKRELLLNNNFY